MTIELLRTEEDRPWYCTGSDNDAKDCLYVENFDGADVPCNGDCLYLWDGTPRVLQTFDAGPSRGQSCKLKYRAYALVEELPGSPVNLTFYLGDAEMARKEIPGIPSSGARAPVPVYESDITIPQDAPDPLNFTVTASASASAFRVYLDDVSMSSPLDNFWEDADIDDEELGPLISGSISGGVLLLFFIFIFWLVWWRRRRFRRIARAAQQKGDVSGNDGHNADLEPGRPEAPDARTSTVTTSTVSSRSVTPIEPLSTPVSDLPPAYAEIAAPSTSNRPLSSTSTSAPLIDDEIGRFASQHRQYIGFALEAKLRKAGYHPGEEPLLLFPAKVWQVRYHISESELEMLRKTIPPCSTIQQEGSRPDKKPLTHSSGTAGPSWVAPHT